MDTVLHWVVFGAFVFVMLTLDLFVFHRKSHTPSLRESAFWTVFWCCLAAIFNGLIWYKDGPKPAMEFLTGYVVEWSLSMDNVFVFAVIFRFFQVPLQFQYRVLFWGILGAILMRLAFVLLGAALINQFHWIIPVFGLFLLYTAAKLALHSDSEVHPENNILLRIGRKLLPISKDGHRTHDDSFLVIENGRRVLTPLFLVLLVIESTDVLFAVDSVPAIFGITRDPFIVFTSNIFAILGLRALYFLLAGVMDMFKYLHYGLSAVLGFVGLNMVGDYFFVHEENDHLVPIWLKLAVIAGLLGISVAASIFIKSHEEKQ